MPFTPAITATRRRQGATWSAARAWDGFTEAGGLAVHDHVWENKKTPSPEPIVECLRFGL